MSSFARLPRASLVLLALLGAGLALAPSIQGMPDAQVLAVSGKEAMASRDYARARARFEELLRQHPKATEATEAAFLIAKAELLAGKHEAAIDAARSFIERHPDARLAQKARFVMADAFVALRRFDDAAVAWRERADFLEGPDYRRKLSGLYLDLAREAFKGYQRGREGDPMDPLRREPDFGRARRFFAKAREVGLPPEEVDAVAHALASCALQLGDPHSAAAEWQALLKRHPNASEAAEAKFGLGRALLATGDAEGARRWLRGVEQDHGDSPLSPLAVELQGDSYQPLSRPSRTLLDRALAHYGRFLERYPQHDHASTVALRVVESLFNSDAFEEAGAAADDLLERFADGDVAATARFRKAESLYHRGRYEPAAAAWGAFLAAHPQHARFVEAQERIADCWHRRGVDAAKAKKYDEAIEAIEAFLERYPVHARSAGARKAIGDIEFTRGSVSEAIAQWRRCALTYPGTANGAAALFSAAAALERQGSLPEAIAEYEAVLQRFGNFGQAHQARRALSRMREKVLVLTVPRMFTTAEKVQLQLRTRNVEKLSAKLYRVDIEEYFRKKHAVGGVEALATDIVRPDESFEHKVDGFERYRETQAPLELADISGKPGAWVLTLEEDEYRATALVVVSDVAAVVKHGPRQVLVWARDEVKDQPAAGVEVLLSDGKRVFQTGKTGDDGVWLVDLDREVRDLRVLALRSGHVAFTAGRAPRQVAFGYSPKGYVLTDRPVYRPGQQVSWKAIVRRVERGAYLPTSNEEVKLVVRDARGRMVRQATRRTGDYGTLSGDLQLGAESALGSWRIEIQHRGHTFTGTFGVEEYRKPEFFVDVKAKESTLLGGEPGKVTVSATDAGGGPLPEAAVRWVVLRQGYAFDPTPHKKYAWFFAKKESEQDRSRRRPAQMDVVASGQGVLNERGELEVSFDTETEGSDSLYVVQAEVTGPDNRAMAGVGQVFVTERGWYALVEAAERVVDAGDELRVRVETVRADHRPVAVEGAVVLRRRIVVDGRVAEEEVARVKAATGPDGRVEAKVPTARAGEYVVSFEGTDRRGGKIEGRTSVEVAGDAADIEAKARVRADREVYRRGETARLLVRSPQAGAWALLSFEGERVLGYRVVRLEKRSQTLEALMEDRYSPNITVSLAIAAGGKLHTDHDEVMVFRYLDVTVTPSARTVEPGGRVQLQVEARDPNGKPVAAELAVAVVDEAVYSLAADNAKPIKPFFYDQKRRWLVRTRSSHDFRYQGVTRRQLVELLAERERRTLDEKSEEALGLLAKEKSLLRSQLEEMEVEDFFQPGSELKRDAGRLGMVDRVEGDAESPAKSRSRRSARSGASDLRSPGAPQPARKAGELQQNFNGQLQHYAGKKGSNSAFGLAGGGAGGWGADKSFKQPNEALAEVALVRRDFSDTAFWAAHVVTDEDGRAQVEVDLPHDLTRWRVSARGVTADTLVGDARTSVQTTLDTVVRVVLPRFLVEGDRVEVSALARNNTREDQRSEISLELEPQARAGVDAETLGGARLRHQPATLEPGRFERLGGELVVAPGTKAVRVEASVRTRASADAQERLVTVAPHGVEVRRGWSGTLAESWAAPIDVPAEAVAGTPELRIRLEPAVSDGLLAAIEELGAFPYGCVEQTVSRFLPAVVLSDALQRLGSPDETLSARTAQRVRAGVTRLQNLQRNDGGWGWWGRDASRPDTTAYALMGLELARSTGATVDPGVLQAARAGGKQLLRRAGSADERAMLLHALAMGGALPGDDLNRAIRARTSLTPLGLAHLWLAGRAGQRIGSVASVLSELRSRAVTEGDLVRFPVTGAISRHGWSGREVEGSAWALLALIHADPTSPMVDGAARWLQSQRRGVAWASTKESAAAIAALARWLEKRGVEPAEGTVRVFVGEKLYAETALRADEPLATRARLLTIGAADLRPGKNELRLERRGSGRLHVSVTFAYSLGGEDIPAAGDVLKVSRRYVRWLDPRQDTAGDGGAPGWSVLEPQARPRWDQQPSLAEVGAGEKLWCVLTLDTREALSFVMVEDPLPAGCEALGEGAVGPLSRIETRDRKAALFLTSLPAGRTTVRYLMRAVVPGRFHALPAQAGPMYEPEIAARSAEDRLAVFAPGSEALEAARAERKPTPDEVFAQVRRLVAEKQWKPALERIAALRTLKLRPQVDEQLLAMRLDGELADGTARGVVEAFEALRDRNPRRAQLNRERMRRLAGAYLEVGEAERAVEVYRRVVERRFNEEAELAGVYRELGFHLPAQDYLGDLLRIYPEADYVAQGFYQVARQWAEIRRPTDPELAGKHYRPDMPGRLYDQAHQALKDFIAFYPEHPLADDAQRYAMEALVGLRDDAGVAEEASRLVARYAESEHADEALLERMRAQVRLGKLDEALKTGDELLRWRREISRGRHEASPHRYEVHHIRGKIHHIRGDLAAAVAAYAQVKDRMEDARAAWEHLTETDLQLDEVSHFGAEEAVTLKLRAKNLSELTVKVYPVDFMFLFLTRKDLENVADIDLTGIAAVEEKELKLEGTAHEWGERQVELAGLEGIGVWLLVLEAERRDGRRPLERSAVVIRSDLSLEVQRTGNRVRVYTTDSEGKAAPNAVVKITDGQRLVASGRTDARGVFEARGLPAPQSGVKLSVVAEREGHYALNRD